MKLHGAIIYQHGDSYYLPRSGLVRRGPAVDLAPVERVALGDPRALARVIASKVVEPIAEVDRVDWSAPPVVVTAAGASGWRSFANRARAWTVVPATDGVSLFRVALSRGKNDPGSAELLKRVREWDNSVADIFAGEIEQDSVSRKNANR